MWIFIGATLASKHALSCAQEVPLVIIMNLTVNILILPLIRNVRNPHKDTAALLSFSADMAD